MKNLYTIKLNLIIAFVCTLFAGCSKAPNADTAYQKSIEQWHAKRVENLKKEGGWLNLAGLYWLEEGNNTIGSSKDNKIVFPEGAPAKIGTISLSSGTLKFTSANNVKVKVDGTEKKESVITDDMSGKATVMDLNNYRWIVIKRGTKYGIRLRDLNSPLVKSFKGVDRFDVDSSWRVTADFVKYASPKVITIPNILGSTEQDTVKGELKFRLDNKEYHLVPISEGDEFFIIFADETNGEETYGAGRFLYAQAPDSSGKVTVDFNKAYNPPCAFTKYATCPLPPKENYLHLKIAAGEKKYGEGH